MWILKGVLRLRKRNRRRTYWGGSPIPTVDVETVEEAVAAAHWVAESQRP